MRKLALPLVVGAAMLAGSAAHAQSFTYDVEWQPVESIGGLTGLDGPQYRGGVVEGTYATTNSDGTTDSGNVKCVGMDQPDGGIFDFHLTCSFTGQDGGGSIVYGCNFQGKPGPDTPVGCIGGFEATSGELKGRRGNITMDWYAETKSSGTGQWYRGGQ